MDEAEKAVDENLWDMVTNLQNDYGLDNTVFNAVIELLRDVYEQGRADAWRWIPVSERKPDDYDLEIDAILKLRDGEVQRVCAVPFRSVDHIATHWLPIQLPGDPK